MDWARVEAFVRRMRRGLKALKAGDGYEAVAAFAAARMSLMPLKDIYRRPLVDAFDELIDLAWEVYEGEAAGNINNRARKTVNRIKELILRPKGEPARPPTRVKTLRDACLWEIAKRVAEQRYPYAKDHRYWRLASRIFTRMKLRLGGK